MKLWCKNVWTGFAKGYARGCVPRDESWWNARGIPLYDVLLCCVAYGSTLLIGERDTDLWNCSVEILFMLMCQEIFWTFDVLLWNWFNKTFSYIWHQFQNLKFNFLCAFVHIFVLKTSWMRKNNFVNFCIYIPFLSNSFFSLFLYCLHFFCPISSILHQ